MHDQATTIFPYRATGVGAITVLMSFFFFFFHLPPLYYY